MRSLDIIITGIPRSGTSYLCGLLNKVSNNVVINEPDRMSILLSESSQPNAAADYYKRIRKSILAGEMIENKMSGGRIIEDTALIQNFELYSPDINDEGFTLCTKNTLGYLSRLDRFKDVMPQSPIFACVRNPIDTIASWKTTFDHLKNASVAEDFVIGSRNDVHLSSWQREKINMIAVEKNVARRRALFWSYLAEWIMINENLITIINYDDVVLHPQRVLQVVLADTGCPIETHEPVIPSVIRTGKRESLDSEDYEAIEEICFPVAKKIGLIE